MNSENWSPWGSAQAPLPIWATLFGFPTVYYTELITNVIHTEFEMDTIGQESTFTSSVKIPVSFRRNELIYQTWRKSLKLLPWQFKKVLNIFEECRVLKLASENATVSKNDVMLMPHQDVALLNTVIVKGAGIKWNDSYAEYEREAMAFICRVDKWPK